MLRLRQDIPLFPGGRQKAFTLSSDDGVTQDGRLAELMRKYHIRGTFNLNSGLMGDNDWLVQPGIDVSHYKYKKEEVSDVYEGFEIAVHTATHPDLSRVPSSMAAYEIAADKKALEEIVLKPVRGMAYPFGTYNEDVKRTAEICGIAYARTINETKGFSLPADFLAWNPTCHYCDAQRMVLGQKFLTHTESYREPLLFYVWGHAYQLDAYNDWAGIEDFFKLIGNHPEIWYATNIEIYAYMEAVRRLIYSSAGDYIANPSSLDVWLMIDHCTYRIPGGGTVTVQWDSRKDKDETP